jgi:hypothetical protein
VEDLSLHILDIAENSIEAGARAVEIRIEEDMENDKLTLVVKDDGKGMSEEVLLRVEDPFFTGKKGKRFGLGIPLLKQSALECGGGFEIRSRAGEGTTLRAIFVGSHIDRKPLGDLGATMATLIAGHPEIEYSISYEKGGAGYRFDTAALKAVLEGVPVNEPAVVRLIKSDINEGIRESQDKFNQAALSRLGNQAALSRLGSQEERQRGEKQKNRKTPGGNAK